MEWTSVRAPARALLCGAALALGACAAPPLERFSETAPAAVRTTIADAGVIDLRANYRAAVCARLGSAGSACEDLLLRLSDEGPESAPSAVGGLADRYRIAFVPGFFAECLARIGEPFSDVRGSLIAEGFAVEYVNVPGRGTVAANARRLAGHFAAANQDPRPYIVFAHSKGLADMLEFLVRYPQSAAGIAAVVGVAGAANGSPLAEDVEALYRQWAAPLPLPECEAGSGEEIRDLRRDVRLDWWRQHGRSLNLPLFSLVAAPRPDRVSAASRISYERLAMVDPRNDGKLLWSDQIAPRSHLLGYVNADHYAVAIPLSQSLPVLSFAFRDEVPRATLVRAAIDVVAATLAAARESRR